MQLMTHTSALVQIRKVLRHHHEAESPYDILYVAHMSKSQLRHLLHGNLLSGDFSPRCTACVRDVHTYRGWRAATPTDHNPLPSGGNVVALVASSGARLVFEMQRHCGGLA